MQDDLERYLQSMGEGSWESEGTFTLDWRQARARFKYDANKSPDRYFSSLLLWVVSQAHRCQSTVAINYTDVQLELKWSDTESFGLDRMLNVEKRLRQGQLPARDCPTYFLEMTLKLLAGREDLSFCWTVPGVGSFHLSPDELAVRGAVERSGPWTVVLKIIHSQVRPAGLSVLYVDLLQFTLSRSWPELYRMQDKFHFSPAFVTVDGKPLGRFPLLEEEQVLFAWLVRGQTPEQEQLGLSSDDVGVFSQQVVDLQGRPAPPATKGPGGLLNYHSLIYVSLQRPTKQTKVRFPSRYHLYQDGQRIHAEQRQGWKGVSVVVGTRGLPLSLSLTAADQGPQLKAIHAQMSLLLPPFLSWVRLEKAKVAEWKILWWFHYYLALREWPLLSEDPPAF